MTVLGSTSTPSEEFFPKSPHSPLTAEEEKPAEEEMFPTRVYCVWKTFAQVISAKETDIPRTVPKGMPHRVVDSRHWVSSSNITYHT